MPVITDPPVIIDVASGPDPNTADELFTGVYPLNGALYALAKSTGSPSATPVNCPTIYKSLDNGVTWANITGTDSTGMNGYTWCWDDLSGTPSIITFAFANSGTGGDWNLRDFDLNTETWSAVYGTVGAPTNTLNRLQGGMRFVRLSSGVVKFVTGQTTSFGGDGNLFYSVCAAGGNWTATDVAITSDNLNYTALCACVDSADRMQFAYSHSAGGSRHPHYNNLDSGNVLGTPFDFTAIPLTIVPHINRIYAAANGNLYLGELNFNGAATADKVGMWTGTPNPTLGTPDWAEALVWDVGADLPATFSTVFQYARSSAFNAIVYQRSEDTGPTPQYLPGATLTPIAGDQMMLIVLYDNSTSPATSYLYYSILHSGVWSPPDVYYNSTTNPPTGWTGTPGPLMVGMSFGAREVIPVQTLELTKIVSGGTAVPGDWTVSGIGGSPETGISGAGHVGPAEVNPGTFELAESGGVDDYAPGVWDCGDAEMPTSTSVVVPEGGVVACQIVNTFIPPPPPSGVTMNAVGCWELLRLDVTLMPSRHLPTRGYR